AVSSVIVRGRRAPSQLPYYIDTRRKNRTQFSRVQEIVRRPGPAPGVGALLGLWRPEQDGVDVGVGADAPVAGEHPVDDALDAAGLAVLEPDLVPQGGQEGHD